jgi:hypothetical protein
MTEKSEKSVAPLAGVAPVNTLTLPCNALDLYNWVKGLHTLRSGAHRQSQITATSSAISAS